jgi:hypothetical protein
MKSIVKVYMWLMIIITIFSAIGVASTGYVIVQLFNSPSQHELKTNPIKGKFEAKKGMTTYELDIDGTTGVIVASEEYATSKEVADVEVDYSKHVIKVPSQKLEMTFKHLNDTIFITGSKDGLVFKKEK